MKKMAWLAVLPLLLSAAESPGRTPEPNRTPEALPLYPKGAPESNGLSADSVKVLPDVIFGAVDADYLVLPADPTQATGQAVVICPGGGYGAVCFDHEGLQVARWFNTQGVTANYQIIVDRVNNLDTLEVQVEMAPDMDFDAVRMVEDKEREIHNGLLSILGLSAKVVMVEPKTIARSEGKAKRVIDNRRVFD